MIATVRRIDRTWSVMLTLNGELYAFGVGLTRRMAWQNLNDEIKAKQVRA